MVDYYFKTVNLNKALCRLNSIFYFFKSLSLAESEDVALNM